MNGTHERSRGLQPAQSRFAEVKRNHMMLVVAFSLLLGIVLAPRAGAGPWPWALLPLALLLGLCLRKLEKPPHLAVVVIAVMVGIVWAQAWLHPARPQDGSYAVSGRVYGEAKVPGENRMSFFLNRVTLDGRPWPGKTYCSLYAYGDEPLPELFDGAEVAFTGRVYTPQGQSGPYDFDFRMWLQERGIGYAIASVRDLRVLNTPETAAINDGASRARRWMREQLARVMGPEARLAMAMLVNDSQGLLLEEVGAFRKLGIAHVLSVSGMHVAIVGGFLLLLLEKLRLPKTWRLLLVGGFLWGYCALTGFSAASVRAAVMLVMALMARALGRRPDPLVTLATAMAAVLLLNPLQLFSVGFVLSFTAMAGILLLYPTALKALRGTLFDQWRRERRRRQWFAGNVAKGLAKVAQQGRELLAVSLAAQLGVLLPTALYFHQLPLYGLLLNLLIVPMAGVLIPWYFVTLALSTVPGLGMALGWVGKQGSAGLLWLVRCLGKLPYATVRVPSAPAAVLCGGLAFGVFLSWYFRGRAKTRLLALVLTAALALGGALLSRPPEVRYIQLSAGQADAALMMDGPVTVAVDVGETGEEAAGYLLAEGRDIDALFLTHLHSDHAGGVPFLLESGIRIGQAYLPVNGEAQRLDPGMAALADKLRQAGVSVRQLAAGEEVRYNKISLRALWPEAGKARTGQDANDWPLALLIGFDGYTIFSAADLTGKYEKYAALPADVLKVAHHGSAESTYEDFLNFVRPSLALISCAPGDRALPSPVTLRRLERAGIPVYRTDETGDITLTVEAGKLILHTFQSGGE